MDENKKSNPDPKTAEEKRDPDTETLIDSYTENETPPKAEAEEANGENQPGANGKKPKKPGGLREYFGSDRFKHGAASKGIIAGFLVVIILLNVVVSLLSERYPSMNLDLTEQKTNTLSAASLEVVDAIEEPTTIYILVDEETAKSDANYRQVTALAAKMAERNTNIQYQYVDLDKNPKFSQDYPNENIVRGSVLVKTEKRYKVIAYSDLFTTNYDASYNATTISNVDGALASAVSNVNAANVPVVAVDVGHLGGSNNQYSSMIKQYMAQFEDMLKTNNFDVKEINVLSDEIPEKTQLLVLPAPITDYMEEEISKIDAFLKDTELEGDRSLLVGGYPGQGDMTNLRAYLKEWGMEMGQNLVVGTDANSYVTVQGFLEGSCLLAGVQTGVELGGVGQYDSFAMVNSVPVTILSDLRDGITVSSLIKSPQNSAVYDVEEEKRSEEKSTYDLAAMAVMNVKAGSETYTASVVTMGSVISLGLGNTAFSNGTYFMDLTRHLTGVTDGGPAVIGSPVETAKQDITASSAIIQTLSLLFTIILPLIIVVLGIVVFVRRRHL